MTSHWFLVQFWKAGFSSLVVKLHTKERYQTFSIKIVKSWLLFAQRQFRSRHGEYSWYRHFDIPFLWFTQQLAAYMGPQSIALSHIVSSVGRNEIERQRAERSPPLLLRTDQHLISVKPDEISECTIQEGKEEKTFLSPSTNNILQSLRGLHLQHLLDSNKLNGPSDSSWLYILINPKHEALQVIREKFLTYRCQHEISLVDCLH